MLLCEASRIAVLTKILPCLQRGIKLASSWTLLHSFVTCITFYMFPIIVSNTISVGFLTIQLFLVCYFQRITHTVVERDIVGSWKVTESQ